MLYEIDSLFKQANLIKEMNGEDRFKFVLTFCINLKQNFKKAEIFALLFDELKIKDIDLSSSDLSLISLKNTRTTFYHLFDNYCFECFAKSENTPENLEEWCELVKYSSNPRLITLRKMIKTSCFYYHLSDRFDFF